MPNFTVITVPSNAYAGQYHAFGPFGPFHAFTAVAHVLQLVALAAVLVPFLLLAMVSSWWQARHRAENPPKAARRAFQVDTAGSYRPTRASDAERDAAAKRVSHAIVEGRLSLDEGTRRIDHVLSSKWRHDLRGALEDLPELLPAAPRRERRDVTRAIALGAAASLLLAAMLAQAVDGVWALWPVSFGALATYAALRPR